MSKRVRMIKDYKTRKQGETWSPTDRVAKQLIAGGFAAEVEEEDEPDPQSESTDQDEEEQDESLSSEEPLEEETDEETDPESESPEEDEEDEPAASDEEEDEDMKPEARNSSLDNVPAGELANLDRPGIAPSVTPHSLVQTAQATSPQRPVAAPLPARYATHRSHIRPR